MGGSGGGTFSGRSPEDLREWARKAEDKAGGAAFSAELASLLGALLANFNDRDVEAVNKRLADLKSALSDSLEGSFDHLFGGSVAKHTYVDGLSDIDSLVLIDGSELADSLPATVLAKMSKILSKHLGSAATVSHGDMAVTIEYKDGMVVQMLPALRTNNGLVKVPSSRTEGWSKIDPIKFQDALTKRNGECGNKLVPTIKLAKAIVGQLPESHRLTGYHVESLAIAAFKDYRGQKTTVGMLPQFFESAKELVLSPIRDRTGQSVHVDDYLGGANSEQRQALGHVLGRVARRIRNASSAGSTDQWRELFGVDL